jgi:hypothetical protein
VQISAGTKAFTAAGEDQNTGVGVVAQAFNTLMDGRNQCRVKCIVFVWSV